LQNQRYLSEFGSRYVGLLGKLAHNSKVST
jgi:hypothetical protein